MIIVSLQRKGKTSTRARKTHYTKDDIRRYCTGYKAGEDSLTRDWSYVTCPHCSRMEYRERWGRPSRASKGLSMYCSFVGLAMTLLLLSELILQTATTELGELLFYLLVFGGMLLFGLALLRYNCKRGW